LAARRPVTEELTDPQAASAGRGIGTRLAGYTGDVLTNPDPLLARSADGQSLYRWVLSDDQVAACWQQRRLAQVSAPWEVEPASERRADKRAADFIRETLDRLQFDALTDQMLHGVMAGYAVAECIWSVSGGQVSLNAVKVRRPHRFRIDAAGALRWQPPAGTLTAALPERKFWWYVVNRASAEDAYGNGLAAQLYWPVWLKHHAVQFWAIGLEKFAAPTPVGKYPPGATVEQQDTLLNAALAMAQERAVIIPDTMQLDLLQAARSSGGDFSAFVRHWDGAIAKIILSQTMTTDPGSSEAQARVHQDVADAIVLADADLICGSLNRGPIAWLTEWNFPGAEPPQVWRRLEPDEDLTSAAARDEKLAAIGYRPNAERIARVYGEGYEPVQPAAADATDPGADATAPAAALAEPPTPDPLEPVNDPVDPIVERALKATGPAIDALIADILAALDGAETVEDVTERLLATRPGLDLSTLADALAGAMAEAHLQGRADVIDEAAAADRIDARFYTRVEGWESQPRVPAGSTKGGQWTARKAAAAPAAAVGVTTKEIDAAAEKLFAHPKLSALQAGAVGWYKGEEGYARINSALRAGRPDAVREHIERLDQAIAASKAKADLVVYRGLSRRHVAGGDLESLVGATIADGAYASTSLNPRVARNFGGRGDSAIIEIRVPKGAPALYADRVKNFHENEVLLPRNAVLKVSKVEGNTVVAEFVGLRGE
jgi:phage gp29-like protein